jgi:hypothetical protein
MDQRIETPPPPTMPAEVERRLWVPTKDSMETYRRREVELCVESIQRGTATAQTHTLYSQRTWDEAIAQLGGLPTLDRTTIERVEQMRAAAIAAGSGRFWRPQPR